MTDAKSLTDAQLSAALDLLRAPPPTVRLENRVREFAPLEYRAPAWKVRAMRVAIAASLLVAVASGALLHILVTETSHTVAGHPVPPVDTQTAAASDEIRPPEIGLVDYASDGSATDPISVAGLPLQ